MASIIEESLYRVVGVDESLLIEKPIIDTYDNSDSFNSHVKAASNIRAQLNNALKYSSNFDNDDIVYAYKTIKNNVYFDIENNMKYWSANKVDTTKLLSNYYACLSILRDAVVLKFDRSKKWNKAVNELSDMIDTLKNGTNNKYNEMHKLK